MSDGFSNIISDVFVDIFLEHAWMLQNNKPHFYEVFTPKKNQVNLICSTWLLLIFLIHMETLNLHTVSDLAFVK